MLGVGGQLEHGDQGVGVHQVLAGQATAVPDPGTGRPDAQGPQRVHDSGGPGRGRSLARRCQADVPDQDLGALVVAEQDDALGDEAERRALHRCQLPGGARCPAGLRIAPHPDARAFEGVGERLGGARRGVGHPGVAVLRAPLVDPERRDRGDHAVRDVVAGPRRVDGRSAEQRVVVRQPDPALALERPGGGPGEGDHIGSSRPRIAFGLRGQQRVAPAHQDDPAAPVAAYRRGEGVSRSERLEGGGDGEQLRERRRDRRHGADGHGGSPTGVAEGGHGDEDVASQVTVGEERSEGPADRAGSQLRGCAAGRRDAGRRGQAGQGQPLRWRHCRRFGPGVGAGAEPALAEVEPVRRAGTGEDGQHEEDRHPAQQPARTVASVTSAH